MKSAAGGGSKGLGIWMDELVLGQRGREEAKEWLALSLSRGGVQQKEIGVNDCVRRRLRPAGVGKLKPGEGDETKASNVWPSEEPTGWFGEGMTGTDKGEQKVSSNAGGMDRLQAGWRRDGGSHGW